MSRFLFLLLSLLLLASSGAEETMKPVEVEQLGSAPHPLMSPNALRVRVSLANPNPFPVCGIARINADGVYLVTETRLAPRDGVTRTAPDSCGTGRKAWEIAANETAEAFIIIPVFAEGFKTFATFFSKSAPDAKQECIVFEQASP